MFKKNEKSLSIVERKTVRRLRHQMIDDEGMKLLGRRNGEEKGRRKSKMREDWRKKKR